MRGPHFDGLPSAYEREENVVPFAIQGKNEVHIILAAPSLIFQVATFSNMISVQNYQHIQKGLKQILLQNH